MAPMHSTPRFWHEVLHAPPPGTVLGHLHELADGQACMRVHQEQFRYLLLRSDSAVHAYVNRCAHFGVPLAQKQEHLLFQPHTSLSCNVHYARYDWHSGRCLSGECDSEGLLPIPVLLDAQGSISIAAA